MRFAEERFANHAHFDARGSSFNCGAQPGSARTDDQHVVEEPLEFWHLQQPPIVPDTDRAKTDVDIGEGHPKETRPRPFLVSGVQARYAIVELVPLTMLRDLIER